MNTSLVNAAIGMGFCTMATPLLVMLLVHLANSDTPRFKLFTAMLVVGSGLTIFLGLLALAGQ